MLNGAPAPGDSLLLYNLEGLKQTRPRTHSRTTTWKQIRKCCMYVCRLLHIGRIRMDVTTQGYLGPRQNLQGIQRWYVVTGILMTRSSLLHRSSLLQTPTCKSIPPGVRLQSNNEPCRRGSISVPILETRNTQSPIPWVLPSSALGKVTRRNSSTLDCTAEQYSMRCLVYMPVS
jgi:hypothetical protein